VREAADIDDARSAWPAQQGHQLGREGEVTQIVCPKLGLKAIGRALPAGQRHNTCIVDEQIERL
jgi:hypothetical protein